MLSELVDTLRVQAEMIAAHDIPGWGNTMNAAADLLEGLRSERDRLAQELEASRGREQELLNRIGRISACGAGDPDFQYSTIGQECRRALAHPSPAAEAIGRVLKEAQVLDEKASDPGCQFLVASDFNGLHNELVALQALRAGWAGEGE